MRTPKFVLPALDSRALWSLSIVDIGSGATLLEHEPDVQCATASVGKLFLLIEVARQFIAGHLDPATVLTPPADHWTGESGILYRMQQQRMCAEDLALLVGAFSDNLATNTLIHHVGLDTIRQSATGIGLTQSALIDYIRDERTSEHPWTPSYGTGREYASLMRGLARGEIHSPLVSERVLGWLASDADTSMLASAFLLDPLAHVDTDYQGVTLRHKTGTTETARIDVGYAGGPKGSVGYAVAANWPAAGPDLRATVLNSMRELGEQVRRHITGVDQGVWAQAL